MLVLTYYLDLPVAEAASVMGIPTGTMKSRLHRARVAALRATIDAADRPLVPHRGANDMTASRDLDRALRAHFDANADPTVLDGQVEFSILTASHRPAATPELGGDPEELPDVHHHPFPGPVDAGLGVDRPARCPGPDRGAGRRLRHRRMARDAGA